MTLTDSAIHAIGIDRDFYREKCEQLERDLAEVSAQLDEALHAVVSARYAATCADLVPFVDGEIAPWRADSFREHLASCEYCEHDLVEIEQLTARLSMLVEQPS